MVQEHVENEDTEEDSHTSKAIKECEARIKNAEDLLEKQQVRHINTKTLRVYY